MATLNPFDLLGDDDNDDPNVLIAAVQKQKAAEAAAMTAAKKGVVPASAVPAKNANIPSKPANPQQFVTWVTPTDKLRSLVRKWQTMIEAHVDVKTTDGYTLRMFCIGFTKKRPKKVKRTCYAQSSQIRRKMMEIMVNHASTVDLKELVKKFIPESIGKDIEKVTQGIYPLQNVFIRKVQILKAPQFDLGKLMNVHENYTEDIGNKVERPAEVAAEVVEA